jgi:hypothetical protein
VTPTDFGFAVIVDKTIPHDGHGPSLEIGFWLKPAGMADDALGGFLKQIFGIVLIARQF